MSRKLNKLRHESALRKERYKQILDHADQVLEGHGANTVIENVKLSNELLRASNQLEEEGLQEDRVGQTAEVVLDAQVVKLAHDLIGAAVRQIENLKFSDEEYALCIRKIILDETGKYDFTKLDAIVTDISTPFQHSLSMFGTFDFDDNADIQSSQKQRQPRTKSELGAEKKPSNLSQTGNSEKVSSKLSTILQQITEMYKKNNQKAIPYYHLIIDPDNMMNTFDNAFQISFLFRDGSLSFEDDDKGLPAIRPILPNNRPPKPDETTQFLATLNHQIIHKMVKIYKIKTAVLNINRE